MIMKCRVCGIEGYESIFSKEKRNILQNGRTTLCKKCKNAIVRICRSKKKQQANLKE